MSIIVQVEASGTVADTKFSKTPEAVVTLAPFGRVRVSIGGSPKSATPPAPPPKSSANMTTGEPLTTLKLNESGAGGVVVLKNSPVESVSSLSLLSSVWDPSSRKAMAEEDPVNVPGKLSVAVIVAPPAGKPV